MTSTNLPRISLHEPPMNKLINEVIIEPVYLAEEVLSADTDPDPLMQVLVRFDGHERELFKLGEVTAEESKYLDLEWRYYEEAMDEIASVRHVDWQKYHEGLARRATSEDLMEVVKKAFVDGFHQGIEDVRRTDPEYYEAIKPYFATTRGRIYLVVATLGYPVAWKLGKKRGWGLTKKLGFVQLWGTTSAVAIVGPEAYLRLLKGYVRYNARLVREIAEQLKEA